MDIKLFKRIIFSSFHYFYSSFFTIILLLKHYEIQAVDKEYSDDTRSNSRSIPKVNTCVKISISVGCNSKITELQW